MPIARINGIQLNYQDSGAGEPVLMVMGTGSSGRAWHVHQVPALVEAGYRVVTVDNRGIAPTDICADGITVDDLVGDVVGLVEHLGIAPCALVGTSMGAHVVQEVALAKPDVASRCVLMATRARSDVMRTALAKAEVELQDSGVRVPARYRAAVRAMRNLSPRTLDEDADIGDWLDLFEFSDPGNDPGVRAQLALDVISDRREAYREIAVPCHVVGFADDLITPPGHGREVAEAVPGATFETVPDCGHFGYLERPEAVNEILLRFLAG